MRSQSLKRLNDSRGAACLALLLAMLPPEPTRAQAAAPSRDTSEQAGEAFRAGYQAVSNHQLQEAREDFQKVVHLVPQIEEGHSALGAVLVQLGVYPDAIRELRQALKLKPEDVSAQTNLAVALAGSGRDAEALPFFKQLDQSSAKQPLPVNVLLVYARSLVAAGQMSTATERLKRAVELTPPDASLLHNKESHPVAPEDTPTC